MAQKWRAAQIAIENLATSISSAAVAGRASLSSFHMPFFPTHGHDVVELSSGALAVGWGPVVTSGQDSVNVIVTHLYPKGLSITNFDLLSDATVKDLFYDILISTEGAQAGLHQAEFIDLQEPHAVMLEPVIDGFVAGENDHPLVGGVAFSILSWGSLFSGILAPGSGKMLVILKDTCDDMQLGYELDGPNATFLAYEDLHDISDDADRVVSLHSVAHTGSTCDYHMHIYATEDLESLYLTANPWICAGVVFLAVIFFILAFIGYDRFVQNRQEIVLAKAARSNAIVASLFPSNVRDRILQQAEDQVDPKMSSKLTKTGKNQLKSYLAGGMEGTREDGDGSRPIADLFPDTTVIFADIAGFTAWSSIREPCQVFELLETLYNAFDDIAIRRRVFKGTLTDILQYILLFFITTRLHFSPNFTCFKQWKPSAIAMLPFVGFLNLVKNMQPLW